MTEAPIPPKDLPYTDAVDELEAILEGLERDELDVDHLSERVARAAELLRECRERIAATRFEVERIVTDLHPQNPAAAGGAATSARADDAPG